MPHEEPTYIVGMTLAVILGAGCGPAPAVILGAGPCFFVFSSFGIQ